MNNPNEKSSDHAPTTRTSFQTFFSSLRDSLQTSESSPSNESNESKKNTNINSQNSPNNSPDDINWEALVLQKRNLSMQTKKKNSKSSKSSKSIHYDSSASDCLSQMPYEIYLHIFSFLPIQDSLSLCLVNKTWRSVALDPVVWKGRYRSSYGNQEWNQLKTSSFLFHVFPSLSWRKALKTRKSFYGLVHGQLIINVVKTKNIPLPFGGLTSRLRFDVNVINDNADNENVSYHHLSGGKSPLWIFGAGSSIVVPISQMSCHIQVAVVYDPAIPFSSPEYIGSFYFPITDAKIMTSTHAMESKPKQESIILKEITNFAKEIFLPADIEAAWDEWPWTEPFFRKQGSICSYHLQNRKTSKSGQLGSVCVDLKLIPLPISNTTRSSSLLQPSLSGFPMTWDLKQQPCFTLLFFRPPIDSNQPILLELFGISDLVELYFSSCKPSAYHQHTITEPIENDKLVKKVDNTGLFALDLTVPEPLPIGLYVWVSSKQGRTIPLTISNPLLSRFSFHLRSQFVLSISESPVTIGESLIIRWNFPVELASTCQFILVYPNLKCLHIIHTWQPLVTSSKGEMTLSTFECPTGTYQICLFPYFEPGPVFSRKISQGGSWRPLEMLESLFFKNNCPSSTSWKSALANLWIAASDLIQFQFNEQISPLISINRSEISTGDSILVHWSIPSSYSATTSKDHLKIQQVLFDRINTVEDVSVDKSSGNIRLTPNIRELAPNETRQIFIEYCSDILDNQAIARSKPITVFGFDPSISWQDHCCLSIKPKQIPFGESAKIDWEFPGAFLAKGMQLYLMQETVLHGRWPLTIEQGTMNWTCIVAKGTYEFQLIRRMGCAERVACKVKIVVS